MFLNTNINNKKKNTCKYGDIVLDRIEISIKI